MPFQLSPGVAVVEKDFSSIVPAVSTSAGAFAGVFAWGPVLDPITVTSENVLVERFGRPNDSNASSFFTAANFLAYTNNLLVARVDTTNAKNAVAQSTGSLVSAAVANPGTGFTDIPTATVSSGTGTATATLKVVTASITVDNGGTGYAVNDTFTVNIGSGTEATFRVTTITNTPSNGIVTGIVLVNAGNYTDIVAGSLTGVSTIRTSGSGSGLQVNLALGLSTVTVSGGNYVTAPTISFNGSQSGSGSSVNQIVIAQVGVKINNAEDYLNDWESGSNNVGEWAAKYPGALGNSIKVVMADSGTFDTFTEVIDSVTVDYSVEFDTAPGTSAQAVAAGGADDELHILVIDKDGLWTGTKGGILEKYSYVSKANDSRKSDGTNNYYKDVINSQSRYVWWTDHTAEGTNWGSASSTDFATLTSPVIKPLQGGVDHFTATDGQLMAGFTLFANDELYDVSLIPVGKASPDVAEHVINNVAEVRKDCVVFISPEGVGNTDVGNSTTAEGEIIQGGTLSEMIEDAIIYRNNLPSSSYAVLDSGYKYQYDRYNDKYRFVPLNGDIAGLCARTDYTNDPWWSPGGYNRGQVKNVVKLAINPGKTERDNLYKNGVNPVVNFPGQGVVLFGDKTLLAKPSAFDRINVRRLFIVLEKAIATAAKFQLFEFNDSFTRAQFKNLVEPFLRDVQGRRGIIDFRVKCDDTNNTGEVIDRNEFVADIFIKPARSINFITLNFVAARTAVNFSEIGA